MHATVIISCRKYSINTPFPRQVYPLINPLPQVGDGTMYELRYQSSEGHNIPQHDSGLMQKIKQFFQR